SAADPGVAGSAIPPRAPAARPRGRILLVDDEALLLSMCAGSLRRAGYEVVTAPNGAEALHRIQHDPGIELLITDLSLPDVSGFEVLYTSRVVRPDLPAIVMSGS